MKIKKGEFFENAKNSPLLFIFLVDVGLQIGNNRF